MRLLARERVRVRSRSGKGEPVRGVGIGVGGRDRKEYDEVVMHDCRVRCELMLGRARSVPTEGGTRWVLACRRTADARERTCRRTLKAERDLGDCSDDMGALALERFALRERERRPSSVSTSKPPEVAEGCAPDAPWREGWDEPEGRSGEEELGGTRLKAEETRSENSWTEKGAAHSGEKESLEREIEAIVKRRTKLKTVWGNKDSGGRWWWKRKKGGRLVVNARGGG